jgi:methylated-DNA-[protein]-cysteine S-methyltransferase
MSGKRSSSTESFYDTFESPVGNLYLICDGNVLRGIVFHKPSEMLRKGKAPPQLRKELKEYFENGREEFTQKITFKSGTEFEKAVWQALREIPYGETRTYKWLAEEIGKPNASRAVGQALSHNPIPVIIPCHRIIESDGSLGGYSGGVDIKRRLLDIEYYIKLSKPLSEKKTQ